eukprot:4816731-Pleurochrysis_carterae.AAC.1
MVNAGKSVDTGNTGLMGANAGGLDTGKFAFGWGGAATTDVVAGDAGNEGNTGKGDAATSNALATTLRLEP